MKKHDVSSIKKLPHLSYLKASLKKANLQQIYFLIFFIKVDFKKAMMEFIEKLKELVIGFLPDQIILDFEILLRKVSYSPSVS